MHKSCFWCDGVLASLRLFDDAGHRRGTFVSGQQKLTRVEDYIVHRRQNLVRVRTFNILRLLLITKCEIPLKNWLGHFRSSARRFGQLSHFPTQSQEDATGGAWHWYFLSWSHRPDSHRVNKIDHHRQAALLRFPQRLEPGESWNDRSGQQEISIPMQLLVTLVILI